MVQALRDAGLAAEATSEAEGDAGSYLLYRVLSALPDEADAPAVGLLRAPLSASDAAVQRGVKAAAQAMARHLSPLPRSRPT
jgi:pyrrolidone-carboxylate peptidase